MRLFCGGKLIIAAGANTSDSPTPVNRNERKKKNWKARLFWLLIPLLIIWLKPFKIFGV